VRSRQLLTIFRDGKYGQQDVDVAILQALFKGEKQGAACEERARWTGWGSQVTSCSCSTYGVTKGVPKPCDDQAEMFLPKGQASKGSYRWYLLAM